MSSEDGHARDGDGTVADGHDGSTTSQHGTAMAVDIEAHPETRRALALFLAAPVVWFTHFVVVYLVAEAGCTGDGPGLSVFDPPAPRVVTLVATAVAAVVCLAIAAWEYRRWQADERPLPEERIDEVAGAEDPQTGGALAFTGFLIAVVSFLSVLFVGLPALALASC